MIFYSIIVTALLIGLVALLIYWKKHTPGGNVFTLAKEIILMDRKIKILEAENNSLKKRREQLENEGKNNFNSDVGNAVLNDLKKSTD